MVGCFTLTPAPRPPMCHPDLPTEGWLGVSLPQGEHVRVKHSSRGSHTTRLVAEQVCEEDTRSRAVCRRRGPWGEAFPAGLCSCPRGNTAWTSRPGRSGWCPRGSLLWDTPPAGSWASHVWPPRRGVHTGVLPTCTSTEASPIPDAPTPSGPGIPAARLVHADHEQEAGTGTQCNSFISPIHRPHIQTPAPLPEHSPSG